MRDKKLNHLIQQLENHLECWKQFNRCLNLARTRKFGSEDEQQFLEVKSIIVQELELILSIIETGTPGREEVHTLIAATPSLRYISELNDSGLRGLENQWHKIYIGWHSVVGQLKVRRQNNPAAFPFSSLFKK